MVSNCDLISFFPKTEQVVFLDFSKRMKCNKNKFYTKGNIFFKSHKQFDSTHVYNRLWANFME